MAAALRRTLVPDNFIQQITLNAKICNAEVITEALPLFSFIFSTNFYLPAGIVAFLFEGKL